jgi:hypothetical protein
MNGDNFDSTLCPGLTLSILPTPAKALATCIIAMLAVGMLGALGQIVVHDIIPTFYGAPASSEAIGQAAVHGAGPAAPTLSSSGGDRGDLFADLGTAETMAPKPFYQGEQFVWILKWTHIHLFGMGMIFIFVGAIAVGLDVGVGLRTWLVVLPFVGILVDILAMWLKAFVSPMFFWLHLPGGGLFVVVFFYVSLRAIREMWFTSKPTKQAA